MDQKFGVAGLVRDGEEERIIECGDQCHILRKNGWDPINESFNRYTHFTIGILPSSVPVAVPVKFN